MKRCLLPILIFILSIRISLADVMYESVGLVPMPLEMQRVIENSFEDYQFKRFVVDSAGSKTLGINMLFTDHFLQTKIIIKYGLKGNFNLNQTYSISNYKLIHIKLNNQDLAFLYTGISTETLSAVIKSVRQKITATVFFPSVFNKAYAADCDFNPQRNSFLPLEVPTNGAAGMIGSCLDNLSEGAEGASVGVVKSMYQGLKEEFSLLMDNPGQRMQDYWDKVSAGVDKLWVFMKTLGQLVVDPQSAIKILKEKFGELGNFFSQVHTSIEALPNNEKIDLVCKIVGELGVDFLISAITVGAGGGRLAAKVVIVLDRLLSISKMIGKGLKMSLSMMKSLSDGALNKLEEIISTVDGKDFFNMTLRRMDCAL
jgi:hypothetical protein